MRKAKFMDDYDKKVVKNIEEHGYHVQAVFPTEKDSPETMPFVYTVGRTAMGRPELLVIGPMQLETLGSVLYSACDADDEDPLVHGQTRADIIKEHDAKIVAVDPLRSQMFMATRLYGEITALQVVYPDDEDKFPGDEGYAYPEYYQPIHEVK